MNICAQTKFAQGDETQSDRNPSPLRPLELPFTAEERTSVTILFGGLTWKHERLIEGLLRGAGYRCQRLPETDRAAHAIGAEFCASGLCNPVYFTVGNLIRFLQQKERAGLTRSQIVSQYIYFTAASGGPCRFGLYENEFRTALNAAGFVNFRVLSFSQDQGIHATTGHTGLQFSVDFGLNALHAFILGDLLNAAQHQLRPFAVQPDAADRAIAAMADTIADHFEHHRAFEFADALPAFLLPPRTSLWYRLPNTCTKIWSHLYGKNLTEVLPAAAQQMLTVEVDWLRVKPVVKVIGEFWAQMTESDGNFRMLDFLEKEGAEVSIEPISSWLLYLLHSRKMRAIERRKMAAYTAPWRHPKKALATRLACWSKQLGFVVGAKIYTHHFERLARLLALPVKKLTPQAALTALASPYYNTFLRGGEGHLEVSKTLYYTRKKACHLVLALKPFGCLPSVQSDGVQAALVERFAEVNFLPVETSAEGEIHAYSRVQMALAEAKAKAKTEFAQQLKKAHHSLEEIRAFVAQHAELRHPLCPIPRHPGVVSTAANFLIYTDQLMSGHLRKQGRQLPASGRETSASALDQITSTGD
jgi:predicted nucleotide-binding protein (sugar kinase/HSP70/actin superfamily)